MSVESHTGCCHEIVATNPESTVGKGTKNLVVLVYHCCVCEAAVQLCWCVTVVSVKQKYGCVGV